MNLDPFPILPTVRVPISARLRFCGEVINASKRIPQDASLMRQRRCFRLAMEKERWRRIRRWPERTIR